MKEEESKNKRFLQTLQEKIYNINSRNEIDNEGQDPSKLFQNLQKEDKLEEEKINEVEEKIDEEDNKKMEEEEKKEKEEEEIGEEKEKIEQEEQEKIDEELMYEERIYEDKNSENNNFSPKITPKNKNLKESIPFPIESNEVSTKINLNEKNNIIINSTSFQKFTSIKSAFCKIHGKLYIKVNPINFEIVCEKCLEEGNISQIEIKNNYNLNNEEDKLKFKCFEHKNLKGSFYCDDCKQFVCKKCFADLHRKHKCHLPKVIRNEFITYIREEIIENANKLKPVLNNSINDIKKIYDNLKGQKDDIIKIPNNTFNVINLNNNNEIKLLMKKTNDQFMGIDSDVHDNYTNFNIIK